MRLTDNLPGWLAWPLRLLLYVFVMFILFNIALGAVKARLRNNTVECSGIPSSSLGGLSYAKNMVTCLRNKNGFFENLLMGSVYRAVDALPSTPKELVGVWDASQPRCNYRHTLKENGEFISEPRGCSLSSDTYHGAWGVYENQFVWLTDNGVMWPPDINPIDVVDKDFFLLVEQDGSRTKFSRVTNAVAAPEKNDRIEGARKEGAADVGAENADKVAMTGSLGLPPEPPGEPKTPQEWMAKGHYLMWKAYYDNNAKLYSAAVEAYTKVIEAEPGNANAWCNRGIANINARSPKEGVRDLDKAIELDPKRFHFYAVKSQELDWDDKAVTLRDMQAALRIDPQLWALWNHYGEYAGVNDFHATKEYYRTIMRDPKNEGIFVPLITEGWGWAVTAMSVEKPEAYLRQVEKSTGHKRRADLHYLLGDYKRALANYQEVFQEGTRSDDIYYSRGITYLALKDWANARKDLETAVAMGHSWAKEALAWAVLSSEPNEVDRWMKFGNLMEVRRNKLTSIVAYSRALELAPGNMAAYKARSEKFMQMGMIPQAASDLALLMKHDAPNIRQYYAQRVNMYKGAGMHREVVQDYTSLLELDAPNAQEYYFQRGMAYNSMHDTMHTLQDWEEAARLGHTEAKQRAADTLNGLGMGVMGWVEGEGDEELEPKVQVKPLSEKEKQQKALEAFNRALKIFPDHPSSLRLRAQLYAQIGENKLALEDITKAIQLAPKDTEAYMGRADLYRTINDEKKAIADWKKAAELGNEDAQWLLQEKGIK